MALFRNIRAMFRPRITYIYGGDYGVRVADMTAAQLYRTQPNLRAVISFLADNAAQIPIKVYDRASDTDRPRVLDSTAALLLNSPNPDMTAFEFKRWMYSDLLLYERFLTLIVPSKATDSGWELRPIPSGWIQSYKGESPFAPEAIILCTGHSTSQIEVPADKFILFHGYDPTDPMRQYSRISALKETLHEQVESNTFRRQMWHRGGRFNAYVTRPKDVAPWSEAAFQRFKETWKSSWAGGDASDAGGMPILEDGMEIKTVQFNSRDAQWAEAVKLSREDCAAVYHVNPAMIWPGSGMTYASAKDNARALYNDCLAPTLMQATDRLNMALLPRIGEDKRHYIAYDITIKTEGTYEEKIATLSSAVGAPFLSRNEARARLDLPAIDGGDELIVPLNVLEGGLASPRDTDPTIERYNAAPTPMAKANEPERLELKASAKPSDDDIAKLAEVYRKFFERQSKSVLAKIGAGNDDWWDEERWNNELADDLFAEAFGLSIEAARKAIKKLWGIGGDYDADRTEAFIRSMCRRRAEMVNQTTQTEIIEALAEGLEEDALKATPEGVFENAKENRADSAGSAFAGALIGWTLLEACRQNERPGQNVFKTWVVTSDNPRASHAAMNGETVPYDEPFSNGAMWPGDIDNLSIEDVARCQCVLEITIL